MQKIGPARIANRFQRQRQLGVGTLGWLFAAWDAEREMEVALRIVSDLPSPEISHTRMTSLIAKLRALPSNHLVELYDCGVAEGQVWYSSAITLGATLDTALLDSTPVAAQKAARLITGTTDTITRVHDIGLLHLDLKLKSLFRRESEAVLVAETGVVHALFPPAVRRGLATSGFAAPEQLMGLKPVAQSDVYSLGACLFSLVTRQRPKVGARISRIAGLVPDFPESLDLIVQQATAEEPSDRFESAQALSSALHDWLERNCDE